MFAADNDLSRGGNHKSRHHGTRHLAVRPPRVVPIDVSIQVELVDAVGQPGTWAVGRCGRGSHAISVKREGKINKYIWKPSRSCDCPAVCTRGFVLRVSSRDSELGYVPSHRGVRSRSGRRSGQENSGEGGGRSSGEVGKGDKDNKRGEREREREKRGYNYYNTRKVKSRSKAGV